MRAKKRRIKKPQVLTKNEIELNGWTSWEQFNHILYNLTQDLFAITNVDIKLTVLQLWATYLGKIQVAFMSRKRNKKELPKLSHNYKKKYNIYDNFMVFILTIVLLI